MSQDRSLYFMGIGGTLMGSLACLAREAGFKVAGFDGPIYPPMSDQLAAADVTVYDHFDPKQLSPEPEAVIVGNANLPRGSAPLEYVLANDLSYYSGAEWLGEHLLRQRKVIAISGTHGKTTTTAMVTWILSQAGLEPGYLIGGVPRNFDQSACLGKGKYFVIEADEYDTSYFDRRSKFLHYRPHVLVVTSLEFDHADIFPNLEAIKYQFQHLLRSVPGNGSVIAPSNHPEIEEVLQRGCWTPITRFCVTQSPEQNPEFTAVMNSSDGSSFSVESSEFGSVGTVNWALLGEHNVANGMSAILAAHCAGVSIEDAIKHLSSFSGVKRRMEVIAQNSSTTVYSDFAHHPTAIESTLRGLKTHVGDEHVIAVIEPRTHTMSLGTLREDLKHCCSSADEVVWFQSPTTHWDLNELLVGSTIPMRVESNLDKLVEEICTTHSRQTHVIIMSNGSFGGIFQMVAECLKSPQR